MPHERLTSRVPRPDARPAPSGPDGGPGRPGALARRVGLVLLALMLVLVVASPAHAALERNKRLCPQRWRLGPWHVKQLIKCEAHLIGEPGGADSALYVAWHESRFKPRASNGTYAGLYQHSLRYWKDRVHRWAPDFDHSAYNARTNIVVSLRMARHDGTWCKNWFCADHVNWR